MKVEILPKYARTKSIIVNVTKMFIFELAQMTKSER
jgi:hypothetical protein